jgi:isopentenyl-diphosphate delta-isomerase
MSAARDTVILVNERDEWTGTMEKMEAHRVGALHRAFSVFLFNSKGQMLLQQRALEKYHSGGLWTNACCSHPRPGESTLAGARRRMLEELGIETDLMPAGHLRYKAEVGNNLIENEWDHLYTGIWNGPTDPTPSEVMNVKALSIQEIEDWLEREPQAFTAWFRQAFEKVFAASSTAL